MNSNETPAEEAHDFIRAMVRADLASGKYEGEVVTRFPPEPNGYLHIGHAKSICLNFGLAEEFGGRCHLRFDDTNPEKEDPEFVTAIQNDIRWLGFNWGEHLYFASDYFPQMIACAEELIRQGHAYVCSLSEEEFREYRGTITEPGKPSPYRSRPPAESLDLFQRMQAGEFDEGAHVVRAKIDMAAPNMKLRDPPIFRIKKAEHYRAGKLNVYPLYDFAHCLEDAFESVTHSLCTLEFENNRALYDWVLEHLDDARFPYGGKARGRPEQTEFAKLQLNYVAMGKRKFIQLVSGGHVNGWDDPRMPTIAGLRRRGLTPESIRAFAHRVGMSKHNSVVDMALLEHTVRDDLNVRCPRALAVLKPLKVTVTDWTPSDEGQLTGSHWPDDVVALLAARGQEPPNPRVRQLPISGELLIEQDDFAEEPPKGWRRLAPGWAVRLRHGPIVRCDEVVKDTTGTVVEVKVSRVAEGAEGVKVKGTIHWVDGATSRPAEVRVYDRLFRVEAPGSERDFLEDLNPESLVVHREARVEASLAGTSPGARFQLERHGYFVVDDDSTSDRLIFNRTVPLKDGWARTARQAAGKPSPKESRQAERRKEKAAKKQAPAPAAELSSEALGYRHQHGLTDKAAQVLTGHEGLRRLFEGAIAASGGQHARAIGSWTVNEVAAHLKDGDPGALNFGGPELAELVGLVEGGTITAAVGKQVLNELVSSGGSPAKIVETHGLAAIGSADDLLPIVRGVLAQEAKLVERYKAGNPNLLGALMGKVMKATRGAADPKLVNELLGKELG